MANVYTFFKKIFSEKTLTTIFGVLCTSLFFLLTYFSLGSTYENAEISDEHPYLRPDSILENIILLFLMLLCIWAVIRIISYLYHKYSIKLTMDSIAGIISFAVAVFSIFWVSASGTAPQADQGAVCDYASAFNEGDFSGLSTGGYAAVYRQQLGLITFLRLLFWLVGNGNYMAYQHFSAIMAGCIIFFCYQITKKLSKNNHAIESIYLLLALFCAPLYFYVPFVYGEITSTAFVALCAWMLLECLTCEKISPKKLILLGLSGGLAIQLRSNTLIFIIGFFIVVIIKLLAKHRKQALLSGLALLIGILLFQGIIHFLYADKLPKDSKGMPATLHIAMGTNETNPNPGWFNGYNWNTFSACDFDAEWANEEAMHTIGEFIDRCREDHHYAIDFFTRKMSAQWNAPMYQSLVMNNRIVSEQHPLAKSIYYGRMRSHVESFMNIYQLLVYGSILFLLLRKRRLWKQIEKYVLLIGIFGGFLFSLIWEAKTRYVFPYFVMMLPYAAFGIYHLYIAARKHH